MSTANSKAGFVFDHSLIAKMQQKITELLNIDLIFRLGLPLVQFRYGIFVKLFKERSQVSKQRPRFVLCHQLSQKR